MTNRTSAPPRLLAQIHSVRSLLALGKPVCLLKDRTLTSLQTDITGLLYKEFDVYKPDLSIPPQLDKWLEDKGLI